MKSKNVLWGLVLILIGVLFILRNLGLLNFNWYNFLQIWPAAFVLWGISLLPVKDYLKITLIVITLGLSTWVVLDTHNNSGFATNWHWGNNNEYFDSQQDFSIPYADSLKTAHLELDAAAGDFTIKDSTDSLLAFSKSHGRGKYDYIVTKNGENAQIQITNKRHHFGFSDRGDKINIQLNANPVWDIDLDAGAASVTYDLTSFKVHNISIDGGAASFDIKVGNLYPETDITIDAGASSFDIAIPESTGCDMEISSVLSDKNFSGFEKIDRGHYRTENYDSAQNKVHINIDAAVSSYTVTRY